MAVYRSMSMPIGKVIEWLAVFRGVAAWHGANVVCRDGIGLRLAGDVVVTWNA